MAMRVIPEQARRLIERNRNLIVAALTGLNVDERVVSEDARLRVRRRIRRHLQTVCMDVCEQWRQRIHRRHRTVIVRRHGEGYVIEPIHTVRVQGQKIGEATLLSDGDEIELGNSVRLRFRKPHVLSASARLEFVSRHRTQPSADGILLMAESCVLGPKFQNHVVCRSWSHDVVLYRQEDELFCRAMESIEIDGQLCDGRGRIGSNSRVSGGDFALSLELV